MKKILTISIAAYNVEKYIKKGLDSIVNADCLDDLEVFVIDDGGTDDTLKIAQEYEKKYPNTFHAIHKENGGYGSTVNWSVKHATGKYFRLLDGDDWLDSTNLRKFVEILKLSDIDCFLNGVVMYKNGEITDVYPELCKLDSKVVCPRNSGKLISPNAPWAYTFKTAIVKKTHTDLPKKTLYTDQIFVAHSITAIETIQIFGDVIYYYFIGREGQSKDRESMQRNHKDMLKVVDIKLKYYNSMGESIRSNEFFFRNIVSTYAVTISFFCELKHKKEFLEIIKNLEKQTSINYSVIYKEATKFSKKVWLLRKTNYLFYWIYNDKIWQFVKSISERVKND